MAKKGDIVWLNFYTTEKKEDDSKLHICTLTSKDIRKLVKMDEENEGLGVTMFVADNEKFGKTVKNSDGEVVEGKDGKPMKHKGEIKGSIIPGKEYTKGKKKGGTKKSDDDDDEAPPTKKPKGGTKRRNEDDDE